MKLLIISTLFFVLSLASAFPRKHRKHEYERRRMIQHHGVKKEHKHEINHESVKTKEAKHHSSKKSAHKVYKKFGMFSAPTFALQESSVLQGQGQQPLQQVLVPVNSASLTQNAATVPEMVSSFTSTPSQRATLGTEVVGDQSTTQQVTTQTLQPQQLQQLQKQPQTLQYEGAPMGTNEDNSLVKTVTQDGASLQQEAGATQPGLVSNIAGALDAGSQGIESFSQQDSGKGIDEMKDLQFYNGPLPDSGQNKPQIAGVSPQEEIKIVNLGDDEKTANLQQDKACGGCPPGAKCVNGQCQIREEVAQAAGFTGKGTASNPAGSISDIHNLETQELSSLLKDASKADTPPTAVPESPTGSPVTAEYSSQGQGQLQDQTQTQSIQSSPQQQKIQTGPQKAQLTKPASTQQVAQHLATGAQQPATVSQPRFTGEQLKELRDFARMYKMYQFIRKMEERLNDPDCAPVCRKMCKNFCPTKCCRGQKVNTNVVSHLMQTADKIKGSGNKAGAVSKEPTEMEDDRSDSGDSEEQDEKKMDNDEAGKKHILIRIVKNNELDKPRAHIAH